MCVCLCVSLYNSCLGDGSYGCKRKEGGKERKKEKNEDELVAKELLSS